MSAPVGVALVGTGLMGRMHSYALRAAGALDPGARARLVVVCGRDRARREALARAFGWAATCADPAGAVRDDVQLVIVASRNPDHVDAVLPALAAGKAVLCEKPLAGSLAGARALRDAAARAGVPAACAFNYRFVPALGVAQRLIARGELGDILHARSRFLLGTALDADHDGGWRRDDGGVVDDLASHHVDLVRWLAGEPVAALASVRALRPGTAEDVALAVLELASGGRTVLEASRAAGGHQLTSELEVDGTDGTLAFSLQSPNELRLRRAGEQRLLATTQPSDPWMELWWPAGHPLGWDPSFVHQARLMLRCVARGETLGPPAASFEDGYRCAAVCDAVQRAAATRAAAPVGGDGRQLSAVRS
ncbi:MAG TPA: Gfo/Idh/MocA family oxidoreductase [Solirubrobacter sp.]|nr:Gfo/Idh/MocA family oxidoreductase [Solirubrobacter sp.]